MWDLFRSEVESQMRAFTDGLLALEGGGSPKEHLAATMRAAHSIKGGCGMLGATELHRMAAELESGDLESTEAGDAQDVNSLDELSAACDRLERMLRSRV